MKKLKLLTALALMITAQAFARYEMIGETKDCPMHVQVLRRATAHVRELVIIHDGKISQLKYKKNTRPMEFYSSDPREDVQLGTPTFDAKIMSEEMARLSELTIYLSGLKLECFIEK